MNLDSRIVNLMLNWSNYLDNPFKAEQQTIKCVKQIKHLCFAHERKRILEKIESLDYYLGVEVGEDQFGVIRHNEVGSSVLVEDIHRLLEGK